MALRARAAADQAFLWRLGVECGLDVALTFAALLHAAHGPRRAQRLRSALWQACMAVSASKRMGATRPGMRMPMR